MTRIRSIFIFLSERQEYEVVMEKQRKTIEMVMMLGSELVNRDIKL